MKRIAIPVTSGLLSAHFGHCENFYFADVEDGRIVAEKNIVPPEHQPGLYPKWVKEQGASLVITGGIGGKAVSMFNDQGIETMAGAESKKPKDVIEDYISGNIVITKNSCDH